jgi:hypothetical protein
MPPRWWHGAGDSALYTSELVLHKAPLLFNPTLCYLSSSSSWPRTSALRCPPALISQARRAIGCVRRCAQADECAAPPSSSGTRPGQAGCPSPHRPGRLWRSVPVADARELAPLRVRERHSGPGPPPRVCERRRPGARRGRFLVHSRSVGAAAPKPPRSQDGPSHRMGPMGPSPDSDACSCAAQVRRRCTGPAGAPRPVVPGSPLSLRQLPGPQLVSPLLQVCLVAGPASGP